VVVVVSGGSHDYAYTHVTDFIDGMDGRGEHGDTPLRLAFKVLLGLVSQAMHDIEWVDSYDYSPGDEDEAIRKCLFFMRDHDLYALLRPDQSDPEEVMP
jgi:hypothetical protein